MSGILVDMDEVLVDMVEPWLDRYNADWGTELRREQFGTWNIVGELPEERRLRMIACLHEPSFFADLKPLPGAIEGLIRVINQGWEPWIVSTPAGPASAAAKIAWVDRHITPRCPSVDRTRIILTHAKGMIRARAIIDDRPKFLEEAVIEPGKLSIAMGCPYNVHLKDQVDLWVDRRDTVRAWHEITDFLGESYQ